MERIALPTEPVKEPSRSRMRSCLLASQSMSTQSDGSIHWVVDLSKYSLDVSSTESKWRPKQEVNKSAKTNNNSNNNKQNKTNNNKKQQQKYTQNKTRTTTKQTKNQPTTMTTSKKTNKQQHINYTLHFMEILYVLFIWRYLEKIRVQLTQAKRKLLKRTETKERVG